VGNLLGFVVVIVTVGVLASAIYILLTQSPPPAPLVTSTPTSSSSVAASVVAGASVVPTPTTIATVSLLPTTVPATSSPPGTSFTPSTPGPTLFVPPVQQGPGFITFGTTADSSYHVLDPKTTFAVDELMVWSADLLQPANSADLQILIYIQDPTQPTGERLLRTDPVTPSAQDVRIFFRHLRPLGATYGTGVYTIQYVRGDQVLAMGSFLVQ